MPDSHSWGQILLTKGPSYNSKLLLQTDLDQFFPGQVNPLRVFLQSPTEIPPFPLVSPNPSPSTVNSLRPTQLPLGDFVPSSRYAPRDLENPGSRTGDSEAGGAIWGMPPKQKNR